MQPGHPEDLHTILSRFHTWAGKNPAARNGHAAISDPEVRELPYEEAMQSFRERQKAQTRRAPRRAPAEAAAPSSPSATAAPVPELPVLPSAPSALAPPPPEERQESPAAAPIPPRNASPAAPPQQKKSRKAAPRPRKVIAAQPATLQPDRAPAPLPATLQPDRVTAAQPATLQPDRAATPPQAAAQPKPSTQGKPPARRQPAAKKAAPPTPNPRTRTPRQPDFKKVLAKTVRTKVAGLQPPAPAPRRSAPDRNRRITTRFSAAEQRRLEQAAAQAGLSVSSWLRLCALGQQTPQSAPVKAAPPKKTAPAASTSTRKAKAAQPARPPASTLFATPAPAPSPLGSWLTLLRNRFLASPSRFSERA